MQVSTVFIIFLLFLLIVALFLYFKWKITATILSAWMAEQEYALPEKHDYERLAKWVSQKIFMHH